MSAELDSDGADDEPEPAMTVDHDPDWHFYLLLCLANLRDMLTCFPVCSSMARALLTMAMRNGALSPAIQPLRKPGCTSIRRIIASSRAMRGGLGWDIGDPS